MAVWSRLHGPDHLTLRQDEILLLYTDGLTEAAAPPGWSEEQLEQRLLAAATDNDLDGMLARLEASAIDDAQGHPRDDIALLALRPATDPQLGATAAGGTIVVWQ